MATNNPLRKPLNRADQLQRAEATSRMGIKLFDVDTAIFNYMQDVVVPTLKLDNAEINVPVIYGNAERWKAAQIDGVYRDKRGKIQLPLIMFKRTTIDRNAEMQMPNRLLHYKTYSSWSKTNKYDKFSLLTNRIPPKQYYVSVVPDYVTITYDCVLLTNFVEQNNKITEAVQYASDSYWGDPARWKFRATIDAFTTTTLLNEGEDRAAKTSFSMKVNGYIVPSTVNADMAAISSKFYTKSQVVFTFETTGSI